MTCTQRRPGTLSCVLTAPLTASHPESEAGMTVLRRLVKAGELWPGGQADSRAASAEEKARGRTLPPAPVKAAAIGERSTAAGAESHGPDGRGASHSLSSSRAGSQVAEAQWQSPARPAPSERSRHQAPKPGRPSLLSGAHTAGDFRLKPVLGHHSDDPGPLCFLSTLPEL